MSIKDLFPIDLDLAKEGLIIKGPDCPHCGKRRWVSYMLEKVNIYVMCRDWKSDRVGAEEALSPISCCDWELIVHPGFDHVESWDECLGCGAVFYDPGK